MGWDVDDSLSVSPSGTAWTWFIERLFLSFLSFPF